MPSIAFTCITFVMFLPAPPAVSFTCNFVAVVLVPFYCDILLEVFCGCLGTWWMIWGLVVFVLGARERIFEGSEVLSWGLGICKAGLCKVKRALR